LHVSGASNGAQIKFDSDYGIGYVGQENNASNNLIIGSSTAGVTFYAADSEVMRIDSSGKVGIGTSSPADLLHVKGSSAVVGDYQIIAEGKTGGYGAGVSFQSQLTGGSLAEMARITADGQDAWNTTASTQDAGLRFYTSLDGTVAERMRIDASGNLLVGHTLADVDTLVDNNEVGITLKSNGEILASSLATVATLERENSDGDLIEFRKDGTTVGSIGASGNSVYIDGGASNYSLMLASDFRPRTSNGAANLDATVDLGDSFARFKDLYLSGGVVFNVAGGTGTSTSGTLDDYEEGTFTPTAFGTTAAGTTTYVAQTGSYTKVGDTVHVDIYISWSAMTGTGDLRIGGLPFTSSSASNYYATGTIVPLLGFTWPSGKTQLNPIIDASATAMSIYGSATDSNSDGAATDNEIVALAITITYKV
jgi:hypothetical protein